MDCVDVWFDCVWGGPPFECVVGVVEDGDVFGCVVCYDV